ncbi:hypothetical protein [Micromonospora avicenniae]|nr:hypothetical protein [Micromonospora avicenniae]
MRRFSVTMEIYTQVSSKATRDVLKRLSDSFDCRPLLERLGRVLSIL